jgi:hypothetical protein
MVEGVLFSTSWTFWNWSQDRGIEGEPVGKARLSRIQFVQPKADAFTAPAGAREQN